MFERIGSPSKTASHSPAALALRQQLAGQGHLLIPCARFAGWPSNKWQPMSVRQYKDAMHFSNFGFILADKARLVTSGQVYCSVILIYDRVKKIGVSSHLPIHLDSDVARTGRGIAETVRTMTALGCKQSDLRVGLIAGSQNAEQHPPVIAVLKALAAQKLTVSLFHRYAEVGNVTTLDCRNGEVCLQEGLRDPLITDRSLALEHEVDFARFASLQAEFILGRAAHSRALRPALLSAVQVHWRDADGYVAALKNIRQTPAYRSAAV